MFFKPTDGTPEKLGKLLGAIFSALLYAGLVAVMITHFTGII